MDLLFYLDRVKFTPDVGFYSLPKKMGRTCRFTYDGLRLISLGFKTKTNKAKRSAKQQCSNLVIVFLVQCSQCSVDQTGHPQNKSYSAQLLTAAERCKKWALKNP